MTQISEITEFSKTNIQLQASELMANPLKRHIMCYGGSRSGKTFILCYGVFVRASRMTSRHCILRSKFNHAKRSLWLDTIPKMLRICFPDLKVKYNKTDFYIEVPNAEGGISEVWIGGLDDKERVEKILGNEYSTLYFNECSQIRYEDIQTALSRLAEKNNLRKVVYYDENPPHKKHWSYWFFIKFINPLDNEPIDPSPIASILMNPMDNINNIDPEYISEILDKMPEKQRNRFKLGLFGEGDDGTVYYEFSREKHVKPTKFEQTSVYICMDFNVHPMCACIIQVIENVVYVHEEIYLENSDTPKMCAELKRLGYSNCKVIPDSTGKNRKTSGKSDFIILKENGFPVIRTRNPLVVDRINCINRLFANDQVVINPQCKKLINDLERVSYKDGVLDKKSDLMLTHMSDAFGYGAYKFFPITGQNEPISVEKMV